ncbi:MAG: hypothetical protein V1799_09175 [bacterium]
MNPRDKKYLETFIENSSLLNGDVQPLNDGEVKMVSEFGYPLKWGRVIQNASKNITFDETGDRDVIATIQRTIKGILRSSAPYQVSARVRMMNLSKPFTEFSKRKAHFRRIAETKDPSKNWKLSAVSVVKGGTEDQNVSIDEIRLELSSGEKISIKGVEEQVWPFGQNDPRIATVDAESMVNVTVKLHSRSLEPNMMVLRSGFGSWNYRGILPFRSENRTGRHYLHTYEDRVWTRPQPGVYHAIVDAITRETLCISDAPVSTSFLGLPYVVQ